MIELAGPPLEPDDARSRIHEELSKSEYQDGPGFIEWLLGAIEDWLMSVVDGIDGSSAAQAGLAVLLALLGVAVVILVLRRTGLIRRGASLTERAELDAEPVLSGEELRASSRIALAEHRHDDATVLALRALVRDLEERTLLDVIAGMTAHEAAIGATAAFPDLRGRLQRAATAFDRAAYSERSATAKEADDLLRLAEYVAESPPDLREAAESAPGAGSTA